MGRSPRNEVVDGRSLNVDQGLAAERPGLGEGQSRHPYPNTSLVVSTR